jgi:hypothetical protein
MSAGDEEPGEADQHEDRAEEERDRRVEAPPVDRTGHAVGSHDRYSVR